MQWAAGGLPQPSGSTVGTHAFHTSRLGQHEGGGSGDDGSTNHEEHVHSLLETPTAIEPQASAIDTAVLAFEPKYVTVSNCQYGASLHLRLGAAHTAAAEILCRWEAPKNRRRAGIT